MQKSQKVIKQGHNTLTITLPSEWARNVKLKAGDLVNLHLLDEALLISRDNQSQESSVEFSLQGLDVPTIWKYFMAAYRNGYDEFVVRFDQDMQIEEPYLFKVKWRAQTKKKVSQKKVHVLEFLQSLIERFVGLEIVEQGPTFVRIKEMGELTPKVFDNAFRRVFFLISQMVDATHNTVQKNDPQFMTRVHQLDISVDKFQDYCIRILNKSLLANQKTKIQFSTLYILEHIGDEFKDIASLLLYDFSTPKFAHLRSVMELVKQEWDLYHACHFTYSADAIRQISDIDLKIFMQTPQIYSTLNEQEKEVFHHLRLVTKEINTLLELRIQQEL